MQPRLYRQKVENIYHQTSHIKCFLTSEIKYRSFPTNECAFCTSIFFIRLKLLYILKRIPQKWYWILLIVSYQRYMMVGCLITGNVNLYNVAKLVSAWFFHWKNFSLFVCTEYLMGKYFETRQICVSSDLCSLILASFLPRAIITVVFVYWWFSISFIVSNFNNFKEELSVLPHYFYPIT